MDQVKLETRNSSAAAIAGMLAVLFITGVTILADLAPGLKAWLASTFSHHWIGKGILSAAVFLLSYLLLALGGTNSSYESLAGKVRLLSWFAVLGTAVIFAFFLYEAYLK